MKKKLIEWLKRYGVAEVFATIGAVLGAYILFVFTKNSIATAYGGMIGENIGFYGFIISRDVAKSIKSHKNKRLKYGFLSALKDIRNIFLEFGFSEALDSLLIRPFFMYIFPLVLGNFAIGIIVGKIAADIVFYIPTIIAYELRKKYVKD